MGVDGNPVRSWANPLDALAFLAANESRIPGMRWVGYLSYDLGPWIEPAAASRHAPDLPLFIFTQHRKSEHRTALPGGAELKARLAGSNMSRQEYLRAVKRTIEYIAAGDIFQVNFSQQLKVEAQFAPIDLYAAIQRRYPAWYGAFLDYGDFALVCNSPELFLRTWRSGDGATHVITRPIKGTRPRGKGMAQELERSIKDQAELNMIVDLERNDLGRVCRIGSVKVVQPRTIETHPTVYHGAATVAGILREECGLVDLLRATFPGGSITGAPKIRAMQIIDELEPTPRGPYCGAIGYIDDDGSAQLNIAIRTAICHGGQIAIPVGGGIVADSVPEEEYEETIAKAQAALRALGIS